MNGCCEERGCPAPFGGLANNSYIRMNFKHY